MSNGTTPVGEIRGKARLTLMEHLNPSVGLTLIYFMIYLVLNLTTTLMAFEGTPLMLIIFEAFSLAAHVFFALFTAGRAKYFTGIADKRSVAVKTLFGAFSSKPGRIIGGAFIIEGVKLLFSLPGIVYSLIIPEGMNRLTYWITLLLVIIAGKLIAFLALIGFMPLYYILMDFPNMSLKKALRMCTWLMKNNKMRYIGLLIGFVPLLIVSYLSFGIGLIWVSPLIQTASAQFYLDLIKQRQSAPVSEKENSTIG